MKVKTIIFSLLLLLALAGIGVVWSSNIEVQKDLVASEEVNIDLKEKIKTLESDKAFLNEVIKELEDRITDLEELIPTQEEEEEEVNEEPVEDTSRGDHVEPEAPVEVPVEAEVAYVEPEAPVETTYVEPTPSPAPVATNSFIASVTMYTLDPAETGGKYPGDPGYGITASGNYVQEWYTVAAGPGIPFGTRIYIPYFADYPNGGVFVVQDRGGAIGDYNIDVYVYDKATALNFGRQSLEVQILD